METIRCYAAECMHANITLHEHIIMLSQSEGLPAGGTTNRTTMMAYQLLTLNRTVVLNSLDLTWMLTGLIPLDLLQAELECSVHNCPHHLTMAVVMELSSLYHVDAELAYS